MTDTDAPPARTKPSKRNWPAIRAAYLSGGVTLLQLSARFGVPMRTIARRSSGEDWPRLAKAVGNDAAKVATQVAIHQGNLTAQAMSLPARSAKLRDAIVTELERDAQLVSTIQPKNLEQAAARQGVIGQVVSSAKVALEWGAQERDALVRIDVLAGATLALVAQPASPPAIECHSVPVPEADSPPDTAGK